jgi:hypothetical protein
MEPMTLADLLAWLMALFLILFIFWLYLQMDEAVNG